MTGKHCPECGTPFGEVPLLGPCATHDAVEVLHDALRQKLVETGHYPDVVDPEVEPD